MIYFVVITLTTVGYGDVNPHSILGQITVIFLIICALVIIQKQTNELIRILDLQSKWAGEPYKAKQETPHIVLCGRIQLGGLKNFCNELFHEDHGSSEKIAVILQHKDPPNKMQMFLKEPKHEMFLVYLNGNPMLEKDLKRAVITEAKVCVVLTNKYSSDPYSQDHKNILTALSIKKYVRHQTGKDMRLSMQLIKPDSKTHFYSSLNQVSAYDQLVVVEGIKMNLLAKSCFSPGIISMISNLITSAG